MTCEQCREAVSARLDGEASVQEVAIAEEHLVGCVGCRSWAREAEALARQSRVSVADPVPDLSSAVGAAAGDLRTHRRALRRRTAVRVCLAGVAVAQLAVALPQLGGHEHAGNEVASWAVAAGVGMLVAAASPRRVVGMLPVLAAAAVVLALIALRDVAVGHVHLEHEHSHGLLVAGVGLLWLLRERGTGEPLRDDGVVAPGPARRGAARRAA